jgi:hypothetical protein
VTDKTGSGIISCAQRITFGMPACLQLFMNITLDPTNNVPALAFGGPSIGGTATQMRSAKDSGSSAWSIGHD